VSPLAPYTVSFLGPNGDVVAEEVRWFEHDDHALDAVGRETHPHEIEVRQGERLVARAPPWPPKRRLSPWPPKVQRIVHLSHAPDPPQRGPVPDADRVPAAADGPMYELQSISRILDDLNPQDKKLEPRPGGVRAPLIWAAILLVALIAFAGWLLVSPPLVR